MTISNELGLLIDKTWFQVHYTYWAAGVWSERLLLTRLRAESIMADHQVDLVKFEPVLSTAPGENFQFEKNYLTLNLDDDDQGTN